ncbi:MAG: tyrosine-type recombinase/integrase [Candidatus Methylumidiphilus sp.]
MLSDTAIRNAKPKDKAYKLSDEKGLYLLIAPGGGKLWRFDYRFAGKRKTIAMGSYPTTSLKQARDKRDAMRSQREQGVDPNENRKAQRAARTAQTDTFEVVAREWLAKFSLDWSEKHKANNLAIMGKDLFPWLGQQPIGTIEPPALLECLRRIENRGALETAHRAKQIAGAVFRYGMATGRCKRDLSKDLQGALPPTKGGHFSAITEPQAISELLRAIDGYKGQLATRCALQLAPLVFVRPGELRAAEWADIDLDAAEWRYLATKTDTPHIVPLSTQALAILRELQPLTGSGKYLFPCLRDLNRPMTANATNGALRRLGYSGDEMTGHGFRAMARTVLDEVLGFRVDYIEHQLAHAVKDPNGRAYNRTAHLPERKAMMQTWADYLDTLKAGAVILPFKKTA